MGAPAFQLLGEVYIIFQIVLVPAWVGQVAGVAHRRLAELALVQYLIHGHLHSWQPVEGVEDPENVDAVDGSLVDELPDHVVRVVYITHGIGPPEEHLKGDVGDGLAQDVQPLPGGLVEEAVGYVEGGPAPHLQGEAVLQNFRHPWPCQGHVPGAHPGGEEGLVGVPEGGVGDKELLLLQHPLAQGLRAFFVQQGLEAVPLFHEAGGGGEPGNFQLLALGVGVLYLNFRDVAQHLSGPVTAVLKLKELGGLVDELGVALPGPEAGVGQDVGDEGDVGLDSPDVLLADGPAGLVAGPLEGVVPGGDLHQQGVVVGGDDRPGVGVAAVQPHAEAAAGAVGGDLAGVGGEVVGRILGGDPALDGVAALPQVVLARHADAGIGEGTALGDENLGPDKIHAGDHLGDGVLHLDAGIHLDEVIAPVLVHQKLHGAGVDISHLPGDLHCVGA